MVVIFAHHCSKHTREICNLLGHSRGKKLTTVNLHEREESKITTYFMQFSFVVIFKIWFLGLHEFSEIPLHSNDFFCFLFGQVEFQRVLRYYVPKWNENTHLTIHNAIVWQLFGTARSWNMGGKVMVHICTNAPQLILTVKNS